MDPERNIGVTETRFALTLLICLLVAVGYVVLLRLAGGEETALDADISVATQPPLAGDHRPVKIEEQPHVLTVEAPGPAATTASELSQPRTASIPDDSTRESGPIVPTAGVTSDATLR
jgi:hypothetical protein